MIKKTLCSALILSALSTSAFAATDGAVGATDSTGTAQVSATINGVIVIKNISDINFGAFTPNVTLNSGESSVVFDEVCIYTNNPDGFDLTTTSTNATNAGENYLYMGDGAGNILPYHIDIERLQYDSGTSTFNYVAAYTDHANNQTTYIGTYGSFYADSDCSIDGSTARGNVRLKYYLQGDDVNISPAGVYSDVITLKVLNHTTIL
jgi:hypothetical protein